MIEKIFEKIKQKEQKSANHYLKALGIVGEKENVIGGNPKKNMDLAIILSNLGLIEITPETGEIIDEYHDYLFKLGIENGVGMGKKIVFDAVANEEISLEEIMDIDPEEYVNFNFQPSFIHDMKEAIRNEY